MKGIVTSPAVKPIQLNEAVGKFVVLEEGFAFGYRYQSGDKFGFLYFDGAGAFTHSAITPAHGGFNSKALPVEVDGLSLRSISMERKSLSHVRAGSWVHTDEFSGIVSRSQTNPEAHSVITPDGSRAMIDDVWAFVSTHWALIGFLNGGIVFELEVDDGKIV
jgi:hypothetical protein